MAQVETKNRATSSEDTRKRVRDRIEQEGVEFVLLWFSDIEGHLKSFAVTPSEIGAALDDGMGFDGSSITGFNAIEESDMVAIPDPETLNVSKPLFGENGSGMHTHQSLFKDGRNAFFDGDDKWHLSDAGKAFIAGQLRHAREISAVFAQWVNSYKRLVPGYEAPVYVAWSQRNRSALIRIPLYKPGAEQATRAEIRCPDPACNPYLTFATLLHAGLEGIEQGYDLPDPMETNLYHLTPEQRRERGIVSLPETLGEAIDELSQSDLARKALGPHIFDRYVELKRAEWDEYRVQLTQWELDKYLSVL
jgi:glutamine synthetase